MASPTKEQNRFFTLEEINSTVESLIAQHLLAPESLQLIDDRFVEIVNRWTWKQDSLHVIPGVSISSAFYGKHIQGETEKKQNTIDRLRPYYADRPDDLEAIYAVKDNESFPELYQVTPGLSNEQYMLIQQLVARELIQNSLDGAEVKAPEVDLFFVMTSIPIEEDWAAKIAQAVGIPVDRIVIYHKACNSFGSALFDLHNHMYDDVLEAGLPGFKQGLVTANVTLFAIEDANRIDAQGDEMSPQFFSSAAAAATITYSPVTGLGAMTLIEGEQVDIEKGAEHLQYRKTYDNWSNYDKKYRVVRSKYLQDPGPGWVVKMDGPRSGTYFRMNARELVKRVLTSYGEKLVESSNGSSNYLLENDQINLQAVTKKIKKVILHHPGTKVFSSLSGELTDTRKVGFDPSQVRFVITEGNPPAVTIPIAWGRQLELTSPKAEVQNLEQPEQTIDGIESDDLIMILSFGAGGSFACGIYQYNG